MNRITNNLLRFLLAVALFGAFNTVFAQTQDNENGRKLYATLTGAAEVPGPGDPDGSGTAVIYLNQGQGEICYEITVSDIAAATMAHIHEAAAGVSGPVIIPLGPPTNGSSRGCVTVSKEMIKEIRQSPESYYVNVHNRDFRAGAVRGQLGKKN